MNPDPQSDTMSSPENLERHFRDYKDVQTLLAKHLHALKEYFHEHESGWIKRIKSSDLSGESNATSTSFVLYYLMRTELVSETANSKNTAFSPSDVFSALSSVETQVVAGHVEDKVKGTTTADLPNPYNSPIYAAALLRGQARFGFALQEDGLRGCKNIVDYIVRETHGSNRGYLSRLRQPGTPSAYFSYWGAAALNASVASGLAHTENVGKALASICDWSESEIARCIAFHEAKVISEFDIIQLFYAITTCLEFGSTSERAQLAEKGLRILFVEHFEGGCFGPSTPVLADKHNFSLLCPTTEAVALLLSAPTSCLEPFSGQLLQIFGWLRDHPQKGWSSEWSGRNGQPTSFMTASALTFLARFERYLDELMASQAASALKVERFAENKKIKDINLPDDLKEVFQDHVIGPLREKGTRNLASYSMILYGPPGSAKTTLAKKIAQELKWPLLTLNQSEFLRSGVTNINAEAERIFRLVYFLKDTVVLFDEVEELVQARETADQVSRLLTTAMLPRIHDLRDRKRIVFIFATNHLETIDRAAARLGRFDILKCVLPPTLRERKLILKGQFKDFDVPDKLIKVFKKLHVARKTENFGYMDLVTLVKTVMLDHGLDQESDLRTLVKNRLKVAKRAVDPELVESFRLKSQQFDRP